MQTFARGTKASFCLNCKKRLRACSAVLILTRQQFNQLSLWQSSPVASAYKLYSFEVWPNDPDNGAGSRTYCLHDWYQYARLECRSGVRDVPFSPEQRQPVHTANGIGGRFAGGCWGQDASSTAHRWEWPGAARCTSSTSEPGRGYVFPPVAGYPSLAPLSPNPDEAGVLVRIMACLLKSSSSHGSLFTVLLTQHFVVVFNVLAHTRLAEAAFVAASWWRVLASREVL